MTEPKKKKRRKHYVVEEKIKIDVFSVLQSAIEKYGAKKILTRMALYCNLEYIQYTDSMAYLFADKRKVENAQAGKILLHALTHWDETVKTANDWYDKKLAEIERKERNKR